MKRTTKNRLEFVEAVFGTMPLDPGATKSAYAIFKTTGKLPEADRLAAAVLQRAQRGPTLADAIENGADFSTLMQLTLQTPTRPQDPIMDALYEEAVWTPDPMRWAARRALEKLAEAGIDVTTPAFAGKIETTDIQETGSMGLLVLGFPDRLAKEPYVDQAERLFARCEKMRDRIPRDDPTWQQRLDDAIGGFQEAGEIPAEEWLLDAVLMVGETHGLVEHAIGNGDPAFLAACDRAARCVGKERDAAIEELRGMAGSLG